MGALDVVGINFELRFGIDFRAVGEQKVMVGLTRIGAVSTFRHDDLAVEHATRFAGQYAAVLFVAGCWSDAVQNGRVIVDVLCPGREVQAVHGDVDARAAYIGNRVVTRQRPTDVEAIVRQPGIRLERCLEPADPRMCGVTVLDAQVAQRGSAFDAGLYHRVRELTSRPLRQVQFDHLQSALRSGIDEKPRLGDGVGRVVQ